MSREPAPVRAPPLRRLEHRVGFADARVGAKEDGQAPASRTRLALPHLGEQQVRIGPVIVHPCSVRSAALKGSIDDYTRGCVGCIAPDCSPRLKAAHQARD